MDTLSDDILIHIFAQGTAKEISLWRRVSSTWNNLINDDFVWKRAFLNFWNNITPITKTVQSWKEEYLQRIEMINQMSCHKPFAIRICTKKTEIQDISIKNSSIKVLNLSGLTSAIIRSDGRLDQKFILFFENVFGEAPITFTKFHEFSLTLGFADGSLIIFDKCPSKSLILEDYKRIPATLTSSPIKSVFLPFLTVHHKIGNCHEFVNLKEKKILTIQKLKNFLFIEEKLKIIFITKFGKIFITNIENFLINDVTNLNKDIESVKILQVNCDWVIIGLVNRILIINIETEEITSSFSLQIQLQVSSIEIISSNDYFIELFAISNNQLLKFKIDPIKNSLEIEKIEIFNQIFGLFVNEFFYILVTIDGIFVYDTLTHRLLNKCSYPKYFLKYQSEEELGFDDSQDANDNNNTVKISKLDGNKFLFIWGKSLAQIWDFNPKISSKQSNQSKSIQNSDKGLLGNKAIRKYSKYAVYSGIEDYQDEKDEEDHLNHLRANLNIEGLTEEELIAYAKLISKQETGDVCDPNCDPDTADLDISNDPEMEMALKLSLIEM